MTNLADKILKKITEDQVTPKPRWQFLLRSGLLWAAIGSVVFLAVLAVSALVFNLQTNDWSVMHRAGFGWTHIIFMSLPYFWLLVLVGLVIIAVWGIKETKYGYRYAIFGVILAVLLLSAAVGWFMHWQFMSGALVERGALREIPFYKDVSRRQAIIWAQPESGLLAGEIVSDLSSANEFNLRDLRDQMWLVRIANEEVPMQIVEKNTLVKVIGEDEGQNIFTAMEIRPWFSDDGGRVFIRKTIGPNEGIMWQMHTQIMPRF